MSAHAAIFTAGPPVVLESLGETVTKEELGGPGVAVASGLIHNVAPDDAAALELVRLYLSYFPSSAWSYPPDYVHDDTEPRLVPEILDIVPRDGRRVYDVRDVIDVVVDQSSWFEVQPEFGRSVVCALAHLGGHPVAVVANQPQVFAGSIDVDGADKAAHFITVADSFHLPLVFLADNPGVLPGTASERRGILRAGARMFAAQTVATTPKFEVTLRKAYGFGSMVMGMIGFDNQSAVFAFPGATMGAMGAAAMSRARGSDVDEAELLRQMELEASYRSASTFGFDELIDPREIRNVLLHSLERALYQRQAPAEPVAARRDHALTRGQTSVRKELVERVADRVVVPERLGRIAHRGQQRAQPQHDHGEAQRREHEEPVQIAGRAPGERLPACHRRGCAREAGEPRPAGPGGEHVVAEDPPAEVDARVAERDHLPVEDGHDLDRRGTSGSPSRASPHTIVAASGGESGGVLGEPLEGGAGAGVRSPVFGCLRPGERLLVVAELLFDAAFAAGGVVDEVEPERTPVDAVHRGHGRDPVPPQFGLLLGARVVEPPLQRVRRRVGRHLAVDPLHDPERAPEPRRVVLEPEHRRDGHVGVLAQCLHHPELRLEVGLEEHGVALRRDAHHEAVRAALGVAVAPSGVEQDGLVREAGGGRDLDRAHGHVAESGHPGEPLGELARRGLPGLEPVPPRAGTLARDTRSPEIARGPNPRQDGCFVRRYDERIAWRSH